MGRIARQFTKLLLSLLSHAGMKWWVVTVLPRALRFYAGCRIMPGRTCGAIFFDQSGQAFVPGWPCSRPA